MVVLLMLLALFDFYAGLTSLIFLCLFYLPAMGLEYFFGNMQALGDILFFLSFCLMSVLFALAYKRVVSFHAFLDKAKVQAFQKISLEQVAPFVALQNIFSNSQPISFSSSESFFVSGWGSPRAFKNLLAKEHVLRLPNGDRAYWLSYGNQSGVLYALRPPVHPLLLDDLVQFLQMLLETSWAQKQIEQQHDLTFKLVEHLPHPLFLLYQDQVLFTNRAGLKLLANKKFSPELMVLSGKEKSRMVLLDGQHWNLTSFVNGLPLLPYPHTLVLCRNLTAQDKQEKNRFFFWYLEEIRASLLKALKPYRAEKLTLPLVVAFTQQTLTLLDFMKAIRGEKLKLQLRPCTKALLQKQAKLLASHHGCSVQLTGSFPELFSLDTPRFLCLFNMLIKEEKRKTFLIAWQHGHLTISPAKAAKTYQGIKEPYTLEQMLGAYLHLLAGQLKGDTLFIPAKL